MTRALMLWCGFAIAVVAAPARADVMSPEVELCQHKQVGDACQDDDHVCKPDTCSRIHYPDHSSDSFACVICEPGSPTSGSSASSKTPLIVGIVAGVVVIGGGIGLAFRRRRSAA